MTTTELIHHVLHVALDDREARVYSITCPGDPTDPKRDCIAWWPCTEHDDDEGPCDEADPALGGRHEYVVDDYLCHPTRDCILAVSDRLQDEGDALDLAAGDYPVRWIYEEDGALNLAVVPSAVGPA